MGRDPLKNTIKVYRKRLWTGWPVFDRLVELRPGILINVFSTPGIGKSSWAMNLMKRVTDPAINRQPQGVLYVTLDTPLTTQAQRWWCLNTETPIDIVSKTPNLYRGKTDRLRQGHGWIEWCDTAISIYDLADLLKAVKEFAGSYPSLLIVDVVKDLLVDGTYEEFSTTFKLLKEYSMAAKISVVSLHHATKSVEPTKPLMLRQVEYAGDKQPDVVLGMYSRDEIDVVMSVLKNRSGAMSPTGSIRTRFRPDWERGGVWVQR